MDILEKILNNVLDKLNFWIEGFASMLPNMAAAVLLFVLFLFLARLSERLFDKLFSRTSNNKVLQNLFSTLIYYTVLGAGLFIILGVLNLNKTVTSLLAGVGVIGLALGFAFQDIAANFVSGIILAFQRPFRVGDVIDSQGMEGIVQKTDLRVTVIHTFQGHEVSIPNKDLLQLPLTNFSRIGKRRIDLEVGVSYGDDLEKVEKLVSGVIEKMDGVLTDPGILFSYEAFGSSSINFVVRFWVKYNAHGEFLKSRSLAIKEIKSAFDKDDITIPFPIRTLDFGIKGGQTLSDMHFGERPNGGQ